MERKENLKKQRKILKTGVLSAVCICFIFIFCNSKTVSAAEQYIGAVNAQVFAFADAGIDIANVQSVESKLELKYGIAVYDVEFTVDGVEYDYLIQADNGGIVKKQSEMDKSGIKNGNKANPATSGNSYIGVEKAKSIAVNHAGFSVSDVSFKKAKMDSEHGQMIYEIEFYKNGMEYEYEINAVSGSVLKYEVDDD